MSGRVDKLLVFLASPGDVPNERRYVEAVIQELNITVAAAQNVVLQTVTWQGHTFPAHGRDPQAVVNAQIAEMSKYELFVGIMWNRLGTATPRSPSGTVEEFERAEASLAQHSRPDIWFYFRDYPSDLKTEDALQQKEGVVKFRKRVETNGLHRSYKTPRQFRDEFRNHVIMWLNARRAAGVVMAGPPPATVTQAPGTDAEACAVPTRDVEQAGAPRPSASAPPEVKLETGTLEVDSTYYIRRESDAEAEQYLINGEPTVIIRASRQMGKSSLLARLHEQAQRLGRKSCFVDFQPMDKSHKADLNALFLHLARLFRRAFSAAADPVQLWDEDDGPQGNITNYLEDAILAAESAPAYVIFDEVDGLFQTSYRDEFFATVRGWHNLRATNRHFKNLCTIISHATTPALWIRDLNQSPFNVGQKINLHGFDEAQVAELNVRYGRPLGGTAEIGELVDLLDGHAYLTRLALYNVAAQRYSLTELVASADDKGGPFAGHLSGIRSMLSADPELYEAFRSILLGRGCDDEMHYERLWAVGLIKGRAREEAAISCRLYESYFRRHL